MKIFRIIVMTSIAVALAGCEQTAPDPPQAEAPVGSSNAGASRSESQVRADKVLAASRPLTIAVEGANEAIMLSEGENLTYEVAAPSDGVLNGVAIQIGNFGGSSEGEIGLRVCQDEVCSEGTATLAGSVDNAALPVALDAPLQITQGPMQVRVSRESGYNPFAVWAYPADSRMTLQDGSEARKVLSTVLFYDFR